MYSKLCSLYRQLIIFNPLWRLIEKPKEDIQLGRYCHVHNVEQRANVILKCSSGRRKKTDAETNQRRKCLFVKIQTKIIARRHIANLPCKKYPYLYNKLILCCSVNFAFWNVGGKILISLNLKQVFRNILQASHSL